VLLSTTGSDNKNNDGLTGGHNRCNWATVTYS